MTNERGLLNRLLRHDGLAAREFYVTYSPRLIRFISRRIGSEADVEEIAQDTLFAFLENARDFTGKCALSTYLCSIASHKIADFYRKKRLKRIVFSQLPPGLEYLLSELTDPQKTFDNTLVAQKIAVVFRELTPHYAQMLKLKYIDGRSVVEIAQILSVSIKAAESILFRARRAFVKLYTAE